MKALDMYSSQIDDTNKKIGKIKGWEDYAIKFNQVNKKLYNAIIGMTDYEVRTIKNSYLRNWIKNLRSENGN